MLVEYMRTDGAIGMTDDRYAALVSRCRTQVDDGVYQEGTLDFRSVCTLKETSKLVRKLIRTEGDAFRIRVVDQFGNASLERNEPGEILRRLVKQHVPIDGKFNSIYRFEPYIEMAVNNVIRSGLYQIPWTSKVVMAASTARQLMEHLNDCVDKIRQEARSKKFLSKLNSYQRSSNKNRQELTDYVNALFERHSRLLVLRVDLSYSKEGSKLTQAEAKRDRERLFENARSNKLFADMVGYIWKLEHGPEKGFHYHMMFFFDGSKVREDGSLARRIGQYWIDVITKGRGLYYNCNASKWRYRKCGIGMISYTDTQLREGLQDAMVYLTKTDLYMKLQTVGRGMGKGNRPCPKDSRGRPRAILPLRSA